MLDFDFIPYNKKLVSRARELRLQQTLVEKLFWNEVLKDKTKTGYKFTRQKPLDNFIADFYCPKLLLVIEIDGGIHKNLKPRDKERSEILFHKYGIKVIRYQNDDILKDTKKILLDLKKRIQSRELDLKSS
jgi:very-short-patch-repair endonuclease